MSADEQPTIFTPPPNSSRPSPPDVWQAPSVEEMQAMLPQYEVLEILGRGGMGAVYKARQKSLKRLVAIKILPLGMADDEFKFAERFQNEAQTMAAMNHPAIVSVYDFGETPDGLLYFVMEFVDGTDVHKMIQASGRLSGEYALAVTAHVCDALAYAHKRGVIHRDIKPANILIDQEGHIKVADFGLAKMSDPAQTSGLTKTNMTMGTPDYVAPEVLSPGTVVDHRADLYAVGVMLYQMLTGEVPRGMFKLPSQKGIGSDPRFDEIICKAMEHDREERYQSAVDMRQALDVILSTPQPRDDGTGVVSASQIPQKSVSMPPLPSGERSQPPAQKPAQSHAESKSNAPTKKQSPAAMWLSIGGIVAVLGVAGFFAFAGKPQPQPSGAGDTASATLPSAKPATAASSASAQGKEIDLLALVDVKRDVIAGEWSRDGGGLLVKASKPDANGTPRLQLPYEPPEEYDFEIEFTPESGTNMVGQVLSAYQHSFEWLLDAQLTAGNKAGFNEIEGVHLANRTDGTTMRTKFLTNGQRHRSTVEVRRTGVRALLDGETLVKWGNTPKSYERLEAWKGEKLRDALHLGLIAYDRAVRFHKITVREITGAGKVDASAANIDALPNISNWKDMTEIVREKLRSKEGFTVGPEGISRSSEGEIVYSRLIDGGVVGDRAVRVRYIGQTQISLWFAGGVGSAFVLAQRDQVMFMRQRQKDGKADTLRPSVMHPASFDVTQPHELLVAVQGATVRVWLDGRFVGEAEEAPFQQSAVTLVPIKESTVQKVEIAELSAAAWTDWLGPKLAGGQSLPSGWKVDGGGVTTDKPMGGTNVIQDVKDAAVRVSYDLRDAKGIQITMRESKADGSRDMYFADDTGDSLYIARLKGTEVKSFSRRDYPAGTPRTGTRTLEFRCVGDRLEATVTGATSEPITLTATDPSLFSGPCAVVLKQGVLLRKVEVAELTGAAASAQAPTSSSARTFNDHRYEYVSGSFTWVEAKAQAEKRGGHLAIITSAEEHDWAWKTFSDQLPPQPDDKVWTRGWWLGASQTALEKPWQWITREPLGFTLWGTKEPSAAINPPRYLWMADAHNDQGTSSWSAQNGSLRGGFLIEWDGPGSR